MLFGTEKLHHFFLSNSIVFCQQCSLSVFKTWKLKRFLVPSVVHSCKGAGAIVVVTASDLLFVF
jgi:hypothetical protein